MPRYTFRFETEPPPHITVTVPAANAEEARAKAEIVALTIGKIQIPPDLVVKSQPIDIIDIVL